LKNVTKAGIFPPALSKLFIKDQISVSDTDVYGTCPKTPEVCMSTKFVPAEKKRNKCCIHLGQSYKLSLKNLRKIVLVAFLFFYLYGEVFLDNLGCDHQFNYQ